MASATRVACNEKGNGDGVKSNGYEGDRQATATRVMAKVKATMTTAAVAVAEVATVMAQSNMLQDCPPRSLVSPCTQKPTKTLRIRRQLHHTLCGSSAWNGNNATHWHNSANLMQNETHLLILH
jgi:hypothetical protein